MPEGRRGAAERVQQAGHRCYHRDSGATVWWVAAQLNHPALALQKVVGFSRYVFERDTAVYENHVIMLVTCLEQS